MSVVAGQAHPREETARRNRDKLVAAALEEFERSGCQASLEAIARQAGVGIGTLYRHFPSREVLIFAAHGREVEQLGDLAAELLEEMEPEHALREWMDRLATFAITKRWMGDALSVAAKSVPSDSTAYRILVAALSRLLVAGAESGAIRADVGADDVMLAIAGLWHVNSRNDWQGQTRRLLDLLMDGLRAGASASRA
jgi:AcrR family transcriptional regulator